MAQQVIIIKSEHLIVTKKKPSPITKVPLYRYFNGSISEHFYTTNAAEIGTTTPGLKGHHGYTSEGIACYISSTPAPGYIPLYRYIIYLREHFYTTNPHEIGTTVPGVTGKYGYVSEGIAGYVPPHGTPLYRYFNGKDHFYTTNAHEIGTTVPGVRGKGGYTSEGIACYVL